ncbi:hypothetical protein XNC3_2420026 [Xenorhabdus nematophila F1]|nr:hypothetical protein XNC3_2420026 [Xenorhabdus nematophila F1]
MRVFQCTVCIDYTQKGIYYPLWRNHHELNKKIQKNGKAKAKGFSKTNWINTFRN